MNYFEIVYYRSRNWIDKKYVQSEWGGSSVAMQSKLKNIIDIIEITEQDYRAGLDKIAQRRTKTNKSNWL